MECAGCGRELDERRHWFGERRWCSASCRRRFVRELRELSLKVHRNRGAIEMPEVIGARDEMVRRYVDSISPVPAAERATPTSG